MTECPNPDGSSPRQTSFSEVPPMCIEEGKTFEETYALTYVKNMCSFSKITSSVVINLKSETPMRFHQSLDDVDIFENSKNYIRIYLAPKIED